MLTHAALQIGDSLDLLREAKALLEPHAVPIRGTRDYLVSQSIYCEDPEGNTIELSVDGGPAIWARGPSAVATTKPLVLTWRASSGRRRSAEPTSGAGG